MTQLIQKLRRKLNTEYLYLNHSKLHLNKIPEARFQELVTRFGKSDPYPGSSKYLNLKQYFPQNLYFAHQLNLHGSPSMNILDIGTGMGYFPFICKNYGHTVRTIDLDDVPLYNEVIDLLEIDRTTWRVQAYQELPSFDIKFDLVTAFMICFNNHKRDNVWGPDEWTYFLKDIATNQLKENGKVFLYLNPEENGKFYTPELRDFLQTNATSLNRAEVFFENMDKFR